MTTKIKTGNETPKSVDSIDWLDCPFCGLKPTVSKHFREDMHQLIHRCKVVGPICIEWTDLQLIEGRWNRRSNIPVISTAQHEES